MSRRFTYSAILVVALTLIAAAGSCTPEAPVVTNRQLVTNRISHEAAPPTIDPRVARQMPLADASSQIYELWWREGLQGFTGMRLDNDKGESNPLLEGTSPSQDGRACADVADQRPSSSS